MNLKEGDKIGVKTDSPYMMNPHYFHEVTIKEITRGGLIITDHGIFDQNYRNIDEPEDYLCHIPDVDRREMAKDQLRARIRSNLGEMLSRLSLEELESIN